MRNSRFGGPGCSVAPFALRLEYAFTYMNTCVDMYWSGGTTLSSESTFSQCLNLGVVNLKGMHFMDI